MILGLILLVIVVLVVRHFRKEKEEFEGPADSLPLSSPSPAAGDGG